MNDPLESVSAIMMGRGRAAREGAARRVGFLAQALKTLAGSGDDAERHRRRGQSYRPIVTRSSTGWSVKLIP